MNLFIKEIEKKIKKKQRLRKWEVISWINEKLRKARREHSSKYFETIIDDLPLVMILALGIDYHRCAIFQITNNYFKRVAEAVPKRHPLEKKFSINQIPKPIKDLIKSEKGSLYKENLLEDNEMEYMKSLIKLYGINAIYFTKIKTLSGIWIIAVDAVYPKKINYDERNFLDALCKEIREIEKERVIIKNETNKTVIKTSMEISCYLINLLLHIFGNKIMVIGGLSGRINQIACSAVTGASCEDCRQKTGLVLADAKKMETEIGKFREILHNIDKAGKLTVGYYSLSEIIGTLADMCHDAFINYSGKDYLLLTDKRKTEKAICAIINKLKEENKNPVKIIAQKNNGKINVILSQEGINTAPIRKLIETSGKRGAVTEGMIGHSFLDLEIIIYSTLLPGMGIKIKTTENSIIIIFPEKETAA